MSARGTVTGGLDPLAAWTFGDEDPNEIRRIEAVLLTTHDLVLDLVLREFLPAYLPQAGALRRGSGPDQRIYRERMTDLPPVTLVYDIGASVTLETPWRPPSMDVIAWSTPRRQHSKIGVVLYEILDGPNRGRWLRLVVSSGNLTRRSFTANLEVLVCEVYRIDEPHRNLTALAGFIETLAQQPAIAASKAVQHLRKELETLPPRSRDEDGMAFIHSGDPDSFREAISRHLRDSPSPSLGVSDILLVSPFYPPTGERLRKYLLNDCRLAKHSEAEVAIAFDVRSAAAKGTDRDCVAVPPAWLLNLHERAAVTLTPALMSRRRGGDADEPKARSTGVPGRPLHAKAIAVGHRRKGTERKIWKLMVGSANLTEHGLGLLGKASNLEAAMLVEDHEGRSDGPLPLTELVDRRQAFLVPIPTPTVPPGVVLSAAEMGAALSRRRIIEPLTRPGAITVEVESDHMRVTVAADGLPDGIIIRWGRGEPELIRAGGVFSADLPAGPLRSWFLTIILDDEHFVIPIPINDAVAAALLAGCGSPRREDRILEFWLGAGADTDDEREERDADAANSDTTAEPLDQPSTLDSWRLNRLLLAIRRRLSEHTDLVPPTALILDWPRFLDVINEVARLPPVPCGYTSSCLMALLLGARSAERLRTGDDRKWKSPADLREDPVQRAWRDRAEWRSWEKAEHNLIAQEPYTKQLLDDLKSAYIASFCKSQDE